MPDPRPRYRLVVQAQPDDVPAIVRLRRWLKAGLRSYGLRCTDAREIRPGDDQGDDSTTPTTITEEDLDR